MHQKIVLLIVALIAVAAIASTVLVLKNPYIMSSISQTSPSSQYDISKHFLQAQGCSNFVVYQTDEEDTMGIAVFVDKDALNLSPEATVFDIEETDGGHVMVSLIEGKAVSSGYCNDVIENDFKRNKQLVAKQGEVTISISKSNTELDEAYTTTVVLRKIYFSEEDGSDSNMFISELVFRDVSVGWLPG